MHVGTCGDGWDGGPNTIVSSEEECLYECLRRVPPKRGYFAFAAKRPGTTDSCACYHENKMCPKGTDTDFTSYRILREGKLVQIRRTI